MKNLTLLILGCSIAWALSGCSVIGAAVTVADVALSAAELAVDATVTVVDTAADAVF